MLNYFKSVTSSSNVLGAISPQDYLSKIQKGDNNLNSILEAREIYIEDALRYTTIKRNLLPCFTLNFKFDRIRRDNHIIAPTGFMYLDIDGNTNINFNHPLLYASWLSLSGKGRGALVRVKGLTQDNFQYNYNLISKELDINSDIGARKKGQVNVLSYDPNIFINNDSEYWTCETISTKYPHYSSNIIHNPIIHTEMGENTLQEIRYDNLDEVLPKIDFDGEAIYDLKGKIHYCKVMIPFTQIANGNRNNKLSSIAYQIRALNPHIEYNVLLRIIQTLNIKRCHEPLPYREIESIISSVMKVPMVGLKPIINATRRFIYNDMYELSTHEKRSLTMAKITSDKVKNSKLKIENAIEDWDFDADGKITQKSLVNKTHMNKKTIEKYYPEYKSEIQLLNKKYLKSK